MRTILVLFVMISFTALKAQTLLPLSFMDYTQRQTLLNNIHLNDSTRNKKWSFSKYSGVSTSFCFFRGGNATVIAAPLSLQINRRLNNNLYAFAGVSAAPAYINFNNSFLIANGNKTGMGNTKFNANGFGIYSRAEMGLMYINDQKTFSISGSIGIERSSYPAFPYNQMNAARPNRLIYPN